MGMFSTSHPGQNAGRGRSPALWNPCRLDEMRLDNNVGFYWDDDFLGGPQQADSATAAAADIMGGYLITGATAGDVVPGAGDGGLCVLDSDSSTAGQGVTMSLPGAAFAPADGNTVFFEARVMAEDLGTTGLQFLLGLTTQTTQPVTGGGTAVVNTTNVLDAVCFTTVKSNDGGLAVYTYLDETGETATVSSSAIHTLVDGTYVKLGFRINGVSSIQFFVDGVEKTAFKLTATSSMSIPTLAMTPIVVCQSDGTVDPIVYMDWWTIAKMYRTA